MSDRTPAPGGADDQRGSEPEGADDEEIAAKMRAVMRAQEGHREGGVDPELEIPEADPGAGA
jgi:phage gp29-like protein